MKTIAFAISAIFAYGISFGALTPATVHDDIPGNATIGEIVAASGVKPDLNTNAVKGIVNDSFRGGTQEVNRVTGSFDGISNRVGMIESKEVYWDGKQDAIDDYASTNAVRNIASSASVTNAGAVAEAKAYTDTHTPGNYATVSNRAMTAVQPTAISDMETQTHAAATYQPKGSYLTSETDPKVYPWAKATTKPTYGWEEISNTPTALPNPNAISFYSKSGTLISSYDGSEAKSVIMEDADFQAWRDTNDSLRAGPHSMVGPRRNVAIGVSALAFGDEDPSGGNGGATAIGENAIATNIAATAVGTVSAATGPSSSAYGGNAHAVAEQALAVGWGSLAEAINSSAIGNGTRTHHGALGSTAIGSGAVVGANATNAVQIGFGVNNDPETLQFMSRKVAFSSDIAATNTVFSNEVLAVSLELFDTNTVAVLNDLAGTVDGIPLEGGAASVGTILLALLAAVAWLKKNKIGANDVKRVYNVNGTQYIDGDGGVYTAQFEKGGHWTMKRGSQNARFEYTGFETSFNCYRWRDTDNVNSTCLYNPSTGKFSAFGASIETGKKGLNPENGDDIGGPYTVVGATFTFFKQDSVFPSEPQDKIAKKSELDGKADEVKPSFSTITLNGVDYTEWALGTRSGLIMLSVDIGGVSTEIAAFNPVTGVFVSAPSQYRDTLRFDGEAPMVGASPTLFDHVVRESALSGKANISHTHTKSEITDFPTSMPPTAHSHASDNWFTTAIEAVKSWASGVFAAITHSHASDSWFTTALGGKINKTGGTATDLSVVEPLTIEASTGGNSAMFSVGTDDGVLYISGPSDLNITGSTRTLNQIDDKLNELDDGKANVSDFAPIGPADYVKNFVQKSVRYQTHAIGSDGAVINFAFNTLTMTGDKTLAFPAGATGDPPRDFLLVVTYTSGSLTLPSGFTYYGDAVSMEANATYLFAFTEVKSGEFYRRVIKMEVPNA